MGRTKTLRSVFIEVVPDLGEPDPFGWATGQCPYCKVPGAFRANIRTGAWLCLPPLEVSDTSVEPVQHNDVRGWARRHGLDG